MIVLASRNILCTAFLPRSHFRCLMLQKGGQAKGTRNARAIELTTRRLHVRRWQTSVIKTCGVDLPKDATYNIPTERIG
jgi:hypothetical protein